MKLNQHFCFKEASFVTKTISNVSLIAALVSYLRWFRHCCW